MRGYNRDCAFCRFMRSLAFSGLGMGLGSGAAYLYGADRSNVVMTGIVVAAIVVFGLVDNNKKRRR